MEKEKLRKFIEEENIFPDILRWIIQKEPRLRDIAWQLLLLLGATYSDLRLRIEKDIGPAGKEPTSLSEAIAKIERLNSAAFFNFRLNGSLKLLALRLH